MGVEPLRRFASGRDRGLFDEGWNTSYPSGKCAASGSSSGTLVGDKKITQPILGMDKLATSGVPDSPAKVEWRPSWRWARSAS